MQSVRRLEDAGIGEHDTVIRLIPKQTQFLRSEARYPAFVASWGVGKTLTAIVKGMALSEQYPGNLGAIFRKEFTDLRDSTMKDFHRYTGLRVGSSREVELPNGSVIMFRHLEELNNIQNINLGWFWIEQAEELETDDPFFTLFGRLRRAGMRHQGMITANTAGHNWIYKLWKLGRLKGGELIEAKTAENAANLPPEFLESLEDMKKNKPRLYARFVENSWEEMDTTDVIIRPEWVDAATQRDVLVRPPIRRIVSIDVARFGDDKTVCYAIENNVVIGREVWEKKSTMESVGRVLAFAKATKDIQAFAVDEIGVGGGVVDRLRELGKEVVGVNASERDPGGGFYNRRAEVYQFGADLFEAGQVAIQAGDDDLREQLSWAKYKTVRSSGVFQVEPKGDIKKRYGRSPDNADAFLNGLWALPRVTPAVRRDGWKKDESAHRFNPATA